MAFDSPAEPSRRNLDGVRRMGYMDSGLQQGPEWIFDPGRVRLYGPLRKNRDYIHPVRAWLILTLFSSSGSVAVAALITRGGHW